MKINDPSLAEASPEADVAAHCGGKERFETGALAHRVAQRRKYRGAQVYRCDFCNGFHLGRPLKKTRGKR